MAKKKLNLEEVNLDDDAIMEEPTMVAQNEMKPVKEVVSRDAGRINVNGYGLINCLRNEKVIVRHINKQTGLVTDPRHVLYGGMAENAKKTYTVPLLRSGLLYDVLTKDEKDYLEYIMGLEPNALSIYNKVDNFWSTANPKGISSVTLHKQDNQLDLSNPNDYIKYKILLANKDRIAPSIAALQDAPKATYEFVIISDEETSKAARTNVSTKVQCYKEFGKIEDDADTLRTIIETIDGRPLSKKTKLEILQNKVNTIIETNSRFFLRVVTDKLLPTKVLIKKAIDAGIISKRGDYLYLRQTGTPLCNDDQEPTLSIAAMYLNEPKHQELKFNIEAQLKE